MKPQYKHFPVFPDIKCMYFGSIRKKLSCSAILSSEDRLLVDKCIHVLHRVTLNSSMQLL